MCLLPGSSLKTDHGCAAYQAERFKKNIVRSCTSSAIILSCSWFSGYHFVMFWNQILQHLVSWHVLFCRKEQGTEKLEGANGACRNLARNPKKNVFYIETVKTQKLIFLAISPKPAPLFGFVFDVYVSSSDLMLSPFLINAQCLRPSPIASRRPPIAYRRSPLVDRRLAT